MFTSGENYRTVYKRSLQKTQEIGFNRGSVDNKREDTRFTRNECNYSGNKRPFKRKLKKKKRLTDIQGT